MLVRSGNRRWWRGQRDAIEDGHLGCRVRVWGVVKANGWVMRGWGVRGLGKWSWESRGFGGVGTGFSVRRMEERKRGRRAVCVPRQELRAGSRGLRSGALPRGVLRRVPGSCAVTSAETLGAIRSRGVSPAVPQLWGVSVCVGSAESLPFEWLFLSLDGNEQRPAQTLVSLVCLRF